MVLESDKADVDEILGDDFDLWMQMTVSLLNLNTRDKEIGVLVFRLSELILRRKFGHKILKNKLASDNALSNESMRPPFIVHIPIVNKNYEFAAKFSGLVHEINQIANLKPDYILLTGIFNSGINSSAIYDRSFISDSKSLIPALNLAK